MQGRMQNFLGGQHGAQSKATDSKGRPLGLNVKMTSHLYFYATYNKTTTLKLELDNQNKLKNAGTTRECNNNAVQPNIVIMSCIVRDNQVMNDQDRVKCFWSLSVWLLGSIAICIVAITCGLWGAMALPKYAIGLMMMMMMISSSTVVVVVAAAAAVLINNNNVHISLPP